MSVVLTLCLTACEPAPVPAPPEPSPAEIRFPAGASATRFLFYSEAGRPVVVGSAAEVPEHLAEYTAVLLGERTKAPDGKVYRWVPEEGDAQVWVARLSDQAPMRQGAVAAWSAVDRAAVTWETATVLAAIDVEVDDAPTPRPTTDKRRKPRKTSKRSKPGPAKVKPSTPVIEIVSISDGEADAPVARAKSRPRGSKVSAPWGWRDVTIFYTDSCGWCRRAMRWMDDNDIPYRGKNVGTNRSANREMSTALRRAGRSREAVPTFVIGKKREVMQGWNEDRFIELAKR